MKAIVTGGSGFIGSHIVDRLISEGTEVLVVDSATCEHENRSASYEAADITNQDRIASIFRSFRPHVVLHQAAQVSVVESVRDPSNDARVNVVGLVNCLDAAANSGAQRFVFASSGGCLYGDTPTSAVEDDPKNPESPYGASKLCGEFYCKLFAKHLGMSCVSLRYSNVYGERQNPDGEAGVVAIFSKRFIEGQEAFVFGDGSSQRDYVHVDDVARANVLSAFRTMAPGSFTALNIGTGIGTSVAELLLMLHDCAESRGITGVTVSCKPARPGELRRSVLDPSRAKSFLGWGPSVALETGLQRTFDWFAGASHASST